MSEASVIGVSASCRSVSESAPDLSLTSQSQPEAKCPTPFAFAASVKASSEPNDFSIAALRSPDGACASGEREFQKKA